MTLDVYSCLLLIPEARSRLQCSDVHWGVPCGVPVYLKRRRPRSSKIASTVVADLLEERG